MLGNHIDSPAHLYKNKRTISDIPLNELFFPLAIIDIREKVNVNSKYQLTLSDVESYEKEFGQIQEHSLLIAHTRWYERWSLVDKYRNLDENNKMAIPSVHKSVAQNIYHELQVWALIHFRVIVMMIFISII